jgi:hypothetical protein
MRPLILFIALVVSSPALAATAPLCAVPTAGPMPIGHAIRNTGAVGRLHDRGEGRHEFFLRGFERGQVARHRRSRPVIGRGGRDRRGVEQRECRAVELGDL